MLSPETLIPPSAIGTAELLDLKQTPWEQIGQQIEEIDALSSGKYALPEDRWKSELENPQAIAVVLTDKTKRVIGFSHALPDKMEKAVAHIFTTIIHPDFQHKGLVGEIMEKMEQEMRHRGFKFLTRNAIVDNGYADKIAKHYGHRIEEAKDKEFPGGTYRFFKIRL